MKSIITTSILFLTVIAFSQTAPLKLVDSIVESKIEDKDPALFVGVVKDGEIIYQKYTSSVSCQIATKKILVSF